MIVCKRIVKVYRVGEHELVALRGIDFALRRGEMVAIVGPSGAGKSSLLNLIGALDTPTAGAIQVDGLNLLSLTRRELAAYRLRRVGFIWQQVNKNLLAHRTALHNVTLPMMLAGAPPRERWRWAHDLLERVGLGDQLRQRPAELSGGQAQRVALAVALANRPPLLLADEPTGALDRGSSEQIMTLIADLRREYGLTVLMVTHDLGIADHADRILTLRDGSLGQDIADDEIFALDDDGNLRLPQAAREFLSGAARLALEIRPDGVLLRSEIAHTDGVPDIAPADSPPAPKRRFAPPKWGRSP
jgi:ABC-type lipoprotein export system ATPase subunit